MRILVSGGGSAGHIAPILATVDALKSLDSSIDFLYVGQKGGMEARIAQSAGLPFVAISAGKYRRNSNAGFLRRLLDLPTHILNLRDIGRFAVGFGQSLRILRQFKPDIIFIKGGFVGLPVGFAAGILGVPYIIHESDLIPGLANKLLAKRAERIAVGFPVDKYKLWPREKLVFTGNPIRKDITASHRLEGIAHFKLDTSLPVILVTGGSLGARSINSALIKALPDLLEKYQVIHINVEKEFDRVNFEAKRMELKHPNRYI
jgi:UDP-N-acetylglucosamine--N-acetylmuramyl-(pentapeptide) pyrophosphoryl-undecaprenol N-acetylglucosamine transferase